MGGVVTPGILHSEPDISGSMQPFSERLAETVSWASRRGPEGISLGEALRSPLLAPPPATAWAETVRAVAEKRLTQLGRSWRRTLDPLGGGRLLLYFPTPPHSRGAARNISDSFFDDRDTPPWDTWVAYVEETSRSYLVAWVPPFAFGQALAGVGAAGRSLDWLDKAGTVLSGKVKY
ncbi:MAG: hypothetical protein U0133_09930 [Gemmatimonadales bacterium]